jgi:hypothetical protein
MFLPFTWRIIKMVLVNWNNINTNTYGWVAQGLMADG